MNNILFGSICDDYILATVLTILRRGLDIIQIVVPIVLIVAATIQLVKMFLNPDDDKKGMKKLVNSFLSAVIVFFIPTVINLSMNILNDYGDVGINENGNISALNISSCWTAAASTQSAMDSAGESSSSTISKEAAKKKTTLGSSISTGSGGSSSGGGSSNSGTPAESYTTPGTNSTKGKAVIEYAKQFLGNRYVYGGTSLTNGVDCSGFVMKVYEKFGVKLPHSSTSQRSVGTEVAKNLSDVSKLQPGDIICYKGHVTLYMGNNQVIHASNPASGIKVSNVFYRTRDVVTIRRIFND